MINFEEEFIDKKIFITGNTGFMGTWLTLWLYSLGANITGYSNEIFPKNFIINFLINEGRIKQIINDVNDIESVTASIAENKPDYVFHLAAQPLVHASYQNPVLTFQTNVMGTINILEAVKNCPSVQSCVIVTSDKCYDNKEIDYAYKETDPLGGDDPYSASKGAAEIVTASYRNSFFRKNKKQNTKISTIRAGNIIGGGDWAENRIIPDCINSLIEDKTIAVRNPKSIRPWQYVLEPISGMLLLAYHMKDSNGYGNSWNFGPKLSSKYTVKNLVELVILKWGKGKWENISKSSNFPHEAKNLMLDSTKTRIELDWSPTYSLEETIKETVDWYKHDLTDPTDMYEFSLKQIENYVSKAKKMNIPWAN